MTTEHMTATGWAIIWLAVFFVLDYAGELVNATRCKADIRAPVLPALFVTWSLWLLT